MAVIFLSLPPKLVLRACVFVPVLQGQHWATVWVSEWERSSTNIKTYGDHCQKWQGRCLRNGNLMADVADADSQLSAHLQGLLFLGQGCDQAPGERQGSAGDASDAEKFCGWMLSLLDQWKSQTQRAWVQLTTLWGQTAKWPGLWTTAIQHNRHGSLSHKTCVNSAYTHAELMCRFLLCLCVV